MQASIGTNLTFDNDYSSNNCPDKSANGMFTYAKDSGCAWGTIDTLPEIPGIAIRYDGHVGVYIGNNKVVEERGFNYGCVQTVVSDRNWTHWYQLPFIDYGEADFSGGTTGYTLGSRLLQRGSEGSDVKALQEYLIQLGYELPVYGADGNFGAETENAVKDFQTDSNLTADGKYGELTHAALMAALEDAGLLDDPDAPTSTLVEITSSDGSANIRKGNGTQYGIITSAVTGTTYEYVATSQNGWYAVTMEAQVGWVSNTQAQIIDA